MNDDIQNLKVEIPSYPDWKKGFKWGCIWGGGAACVLLLISFKVPPVPPLDGKPMTIGEEIIFKTAFCTFIFLIVGFFFGLLAAFRPKFHTKQKP